VINLTLAREEVARLRTNHASIGHTGPLGQLAITGPSYDGPLDSLRLTLDEIAQLERDGVLVGTRFTLTIAETA
jgi:hypothetical protein